MEFHGDGGKSVRKLAFGVTIAWLVLGYSATVPGEGILQVIPEKSLVAVITRNAEEAEKHIHPVLEKLVTHLPKGSLVEEVLREFKLRPPVPAGGPAVPEGAAAPSTIDLTGPFALVRVSAPEDALGTAIAVVVKVRNYKDLLGELAKVVGAVAPGGAADGIDRLKGDKQSLYVLSSGDYAVVADAEYVIKTFKTEAAKNLAVAGFPELAKAYETYDVAVYHNVDAIAKRYAADIDMYEQGLMEQIKDPPKDEPVMMDPKKAAQSFTALADYVVKSWTETDAILWGLTFRDEGVRVSAMVRPVPGTPFAGQVGRMRPAKAEVQEFLSGPAVASAAWSIDAQTLKELIAPLDGIVPKVALADNKDGKKSFMEALRKLTDAATGPGAYVWSPPGDEKGMVRITCLVPILMGADVFAIVKDLVASSTELLNSCGGPVRTKTKFEDGVETYRDCRIDRITDTFELTPGAAAPAGANANVLKLVEGVYGKELVTYVTRAHDILVTTIGYPAIDAIKAQVDRILDNRHGDLAAGASYQNALQGLPAERCVESVFSLATMLRFSSAEQALVDGKDRAEVIDQVKFDRPAGIGLTVAPAGQDLAIDFNISIQEMQDIRELILEKQRQEAAKEAAKPKKPARVFGPATGK